MDLKFTFHFSFFPLFAFSVTSFAADNIDKSFGTDGQVVTSISRGHDRAEVVAIQGDGKVVVAGIANYPGKSDVFLARYTKSGKLDPSFGEDGVVITTLGGLQQVHGLAIRKNGRIVVGGYTGRNWKTDLLLIQYDSSGKIDKNFGNDGLVVEDFGGKDELHYLVIQEDGELIAAGFSVKGGNADFIIARYEKNGLLDKDFGGG